MNACLAADAFSQAGVVASGLPAEALRCQAHLQFEKALSQGKLQHLWHQLTGRATHLENLEEAHDEARLKSEHYSGVQMVPIKQIVGSAGRHDEFTPDFKPLHQRNRWRWIDVAVVRLSGSVLPPVELLQIGSHYYVLDGHHRISVAQSYGQKEIEAQVTVRES